MRIGIDAWGLAGATLHTGMGQYARHLVSGLSEHAELVAYGAPDERRPEWLPDAVTWRTPAAPGPAKAAAIASRLFSLKRAAASDALDVFHAPATHLRPSMPPVPFAPCPVVTTVHDLIPLTYYGRDLPLRLRIFYRWNLRRALSSAAVITVSEAARREIIARGGMKPEHVVAIHNGIDFAPNRDETPLAHLRIPRPYVLYAGSWEPRKNLRAALDAYAICVRMGVTHGLTAIVDADSGHAAATRKHLAALQLGDRVRLVHSLDDGDIRALYTHADAVLFPSLAEGFGFPPLQAGACSVPVVASGIDAIRETMGDAAVYVDPRDADAIAIGLMRVLNDAVLAQRLRKAGYERAVSFTWEHSVRAHLDVFARVTRRAPKT